MSMIIIIIKYSDNILHTMMQIILELMMLQLYSPVKIIKIMKSYTSRIILNDNRADHDDYHNNNDKSTNTIKMADHYH